MLDRKKPIKYWALQLLISLVWYSRKKFKEYCVSEMTFFWY